MTVTYTIIRIFNGYTQKFAFMKLTPVWLRDPLPLACSVRSVETNSISFCNKLGIIKRLFKREFTFGFYLYDLRKPEFRDKGGYMHIKTKESTGIRETDRTSGLSAYGSAQTWRRMFVLFIYFFVCRLIAFFSFFQSGVYVTFSKLRRVFYMIRKKVVWNQLFSSGWMEDTGLVQKIPWVLWACSVSCFSPRNHQKNHLLAMTKIINLNIKNLLFEAVHS